MPIGIMHGGFLGTRGSLMLDVVVVAMVLVSVVLLVSVGLVRFRKNHRLHRRIQITLALVLLVALTAFEIDMQFLTDWRELAKPSPWFENGWVNRLLWIHLAFAIPTPFVWGLVIFFAMRHYRDGFSNPAHAGRHRIGGRIGVLFMLMTSVTGWIFYWTAFVA